MQYSKPSDEFRLAKQSMLEAVAEGFGWDLKGPEMNPGPAAYAEMRALLAKPYLTEGEKGWQVPPQMRSTTQRLHGRLYNENRPNGNRNVNRLTEYDPSHLDLIAAIHDQYTLCRYWDQQADEQYDERDVNGIAFDRQIRAIEAVRAQIAPYYLHMLMEQGMEEAQAVKVIGNAIYGFADTIATLSVTADGEKEMVTVHPEKGTGFTPSAIVQQIDSYARVQQSMIAQDGANALSVADGR